MKYLGDAIKQLPYLTKLKLRLPRNNLGDNVENMQCLGDGIKYLSKLQSLELVINENYLGYNVVNRLYFRNVFKFANL